MAKPVVLLTKKSFYAPGWIESRWPKLVEQCEIRLTSLTSGPEWTAEVADADVVIARSTPVRRDVMEAAPRLRGLVTTGAGSDHLDVAAATELGISISNSPGNYVAVAEATMLFINALSKQLMTWIEVGRTGRQTDADLMGLELRETTLGLVGYGQIAREVARLAQGFGMRVLAHHPRLRETELAELVSLERLLQESDFVSLHPSLNSETRGMIGAAQLAMMKPTAYLVNISRGPVVDEAALIEALRAGTIAGAALDVWDVEPPPTDHPLLSMPNVIATPHAIAKAAQSFRRCAVMTEQNVLAVLAGEIPPYAINPSVRPRVLQQA